MCRNKLTQVAGHYEMKSTGGIFYGRFFLRSVHTMQEKFENEIFTLKTHQLMFCVNNFGFVTEESWGSGIIIVTPLFFKTIKGFLECLPCTQKRKAGVIKFVRL